MPFGLQNAARAFQWLVMDTGCTGMEFVFVYLDDILMASSMSVENHNHLWQLFACLVEHGLVVNVAKCEFGKPTLEFLGHRIDKYRASILPSKVQPVAVFPALGTLKGLQEFLGMVMYYYHFLPSWLPHSNLYSQ